MAQMNGAKHKVKKEVKVQTTPKVEKPEYEFCGPIGTFVLITVLPLLVYSFGLLCNDISGCPVPSLLSPSTLTLERLKAEIGWPENGIIGLVDLKVTGWVLAYYGLLVVLQLLLPGTELEGVKLACGRRHKYKFNTFLTANVILCGLAIGTWLQGPDFPVWPYIWENRIQILTASQLISIFLSIYVYVGSFSVPSAGPNPSNRELASGGHTGNIVYDFWIGRELNPRINIPSSIPLIGGQAIDVKVFCELRPGMLGWLILNLTSCMQQYRTYGYISDSMVLVNLFQGLYVLDSFYNEPAILTTMDIIMDGFGFMLCFGDLVWVPFVYGMQARYLAVYPVHLGLTGILTTLAVQGTGYYIFRGANSEKNAFRTNPSDPKVAHLKYIETASGSRLITSGWWGLARHINYLGDWTMAWSYCLPTGLAGYVITYYTNPATGAITKAVEQGPARGWGVVATYFYVIYFAVLLVHRESRDEEKCRKKYGKDWERYTSVVRSRIIPGVY